MQMKSFTEPEFTLRPWLPSSTGERDGVYGRPCVLFYMKPSRREALPSRTTRMPRDNRENSKIFFGSTAGKGVLVGFVGTRSFASGWAAGALFSALTARAQSSDAGIKDFLGEDSPETVDFSQFLDGSNIGCTAESHFPLVHYFPDDFKRLD